MNGFGSLGHKQGTISRWIAAMPWLAIGGFLGLCLLYWLRFSGNELSSNPSAWGEFGDYVGGLLNPLVATLALVALVISIRIQKNELTETRGALEKQVALDNMFSLLQQHRELVSTVRLQSDAQCLDAKRSEAAEKSYGGRDAFSAVVRSLEWYDNGNYDEAIRVQQAIDFRFTVASADSFVPQLWFTAWYRNEACGLIGVERGTPFKNSLEASFGHIFRSICQTLKFIHNLDPALFSSRAKLDLVNYLRAQMSEDEFVLYALSALTDIGEKSRAIAIAFDFFQKRMTYSTRWARSMQLLFSADHSDNIAWARTRGYERVA